MTWICQLDYFDPVDSTETFVRLSLGPGVSTLDAGYVPGGLLKWASPNQKITTDSNGVISASTDQGEIDILNVPDAVAGAGRLDWLITKIFQGRSATLYWLPEGAAWADAVLSSSGVLEQPYADPQLGDTPTAQIVFQTRDPRSVLTANLQTTLYAGTNVGSAGVEGTATDIMGKPKPILYGRASNIPGVQVNTSQLIWQVSDATAYVDCVRDGGVALTPAVQRGNLASLYANTPSPGYYDWCNVSSEGTFVKVGSTPQFSLGMDVYEGATIADRTVAQIWNRMRQDRCFTTSGQIDSSSITAADALDSGESGFWWDGVLTQVNALDQVLQAFSGYEFLSTAGLWTIEKLTVPLSTDTPAFNFIIPERTTIKGLTDRDLVTLTFVRPDYSPDGAPPYQVTVNWGEAYTVMSATDFAGAAIQRLQQKFAQQYRTSVAANTALWNPVTNTGPWKNAPAFLMTSAYAVDSGGLTCAAADAEAARLLAMFGVQRLQAQLTFKGEPGDIIDPGMVMKMTIASYGLSGGALFKVLQSKEQLDLNGYQISLIIGLQHLPGDP